MENKISEILAKLRPEFDFTQSTDFIEDCLLDSFDIVALVNELEGFFSISIDGEDIVPENFSTIESMVNLVKKSEKI